ncbi:MAG: sugar ABC transporter ATP-binding protein [Acetivibrionales bacterium]|jgi:simple sugar transport system ATP-binding protein
MEAVLSAQNINKSFIGVHALKDISIMVYPGEIHCLVGENGCGKSTLVKCISGVYSPDSGKIFLNGRVYSSLTPRQAMKEGVQVIYQDLSLFQHMTIAENIAISKLRFENRKFVNWKEIHDIADQQLQKVGVQMDLNQTVGEASLANRQLTAICRALAQDAKILFMDEPTTALTKKEVSQLLKVIVELKKKGLAIVFISHKLDEVFSVADVISVFRNGIKIGDFKREELDEKKLSFYMTGREVEYPRYYRSCKDDTPIIEINNLTRKGQYKNINMTVRAGDIIGLTGLLGSGRTELAMSLFGLNPAQFGVIKIDGKEIKITSPMVAKKHRIALLPEDRFTQGLFMDRKIKENITSAIVNEISKNNFLDNKKEDELASHYVKELKVRTPSIDTIAGTLSGGNQQKVVIAKWIANKPRVFIMDTPTVGIDIGSKAEIYEQIHKFADEGMAIILISDEIQEILANCNRLMILSGGKCVAVMEEEELRQPDAEKRISELVSQQVQKEGERVLA